MMRIILATLIICAAISAAWAHRHDRPELQGWLAGLHDSNGISCCDSSEATRLDDPEWKNDNGHYFIFLEGEWIEVPDKAVINEPNKYGEALVWPWHENGHPKVRCFIPGSQS